MMYLYLTWISVNTLVLAWISTYPGTYTLIIFVKMLKPKVGIISRLRHILNKNLLNIVYKTIIQPHIDYAITLWGSSSISNVTKLILMV